MKIWTPDHKLLLPDWRDLWKKPHRRKPWFHGRGWRPCCCSGPGACRCDGITLPSTLNFSITGPVECACANGGLSGTLSWNDGPVTLNSTDWGSGWLATFDPFCSADNWSLTKLFLSCKYNDTVGYSLVVEQDSSNNGCLFGVRSTGGCANMSGSWVCDSNTSVWDCDPFEITWYLPIGSYAANECCGVVDDAIGCYTVIITD